VDKAALSNDKVHKKQRKRLAITKQDTVTFIISLFGFFLGRVEVLSIMNPVGIAFISSFLGKGHRLYLVTFFTGLGILTKFNGMYFTRYLFAMALIIGIDFITQNRGIKVNKLTKAIFSATSILIPSLIINLLFDRGMYWNTMALLEAALAFSLVYIVHDGINIIDGKQKLINNETLMSLAILFGLIVAGSADVYIANISVKFFLSSFIVLVISSKGGSSLGAATGVLLGFILSISGAGNTTLIGILSMAGLISGLMRNIKYGGTILGFIAGGLITALYLDINMLNLGILYSVVLASVLSVLLPKNFNFNLQEVVNPTADNSDEYIDRVKELTTYKLQGFSNSFKNLANTFSGLSEKKSVLDQHDITKLIDDVANKTCHNCTNRRNCWEDNFYNTYQMYFAMLGICEKKGNLVREDIPENLSKLCTHMERLMDNTNRTFELYKNNLLWHNKIVESRELVSQQLSGVAGIIQNLSEELNMEINFKMNLEENLLIELNKNKVEVDSVIVIENNQDKYEVTLNHKSCYGKKSCTKDIIPIVSKVLGRKMRRDVEDCHIGGTTNQKTSKCKIRLVEEQRYRMANGVSRIMKEESKESGDSYSFMNMKGAQCLLVLSDGMGSGKKAREESAAAVDLLEDFIDTGFDKETAIKMINSVLVLKSNEDSFSTLDICSVDLYTGVSEFIKIGASSTFILRGEEVQVIRSSSLPMGILNTVDVEVTNKRLRDGDIIVMVTDGLTEIYDSESDKEKWIVDALSSFKSNNPQDIADYLLREAKTRSNGIIKDDMTIMAARLWEKI